MAALGALGTALGMAAPHMAHHAGWLAGSGVLAGTSGRWALGAVGLVLTVPMLRRLRRRTGSWRLPAAAFAGMLLLVLASSALLMPRSAGGVPAGAASVIEADLSVRYDSGTGRRASATLRCASGAARATGFLRARSARRLCSGLPGIREALLSAGRREGPCTEQYGGPDRAVVLGSLNGREVRRTFTREDGCAISDWARVARLLPRPVGLEDRAGDHRVGVRP